jgi:hypothetical protein
MTGMNMGVCFIKNSNAGYNVGPSTVKHAGCPKNLERGQARSVPDETQVHFGRVALRQK